MRLTAMDTILAINASAGGVNFQLFSVQGEGRLGRQIKGQLDGLGSSPRLKASGVNGDPLAHRVYRNDDVGGVPTAFGVVDAWLRDELGIRPLAVGHRVTQGGPDDVRPVLIDDAVMARLERLTAIAPLHQPHNLAPIRAIQANHPALTQVACFDTAFHLARPAGRAGPPTAHRHDAEGKRHHGIHGLSYESIARTLSLIAPDVAKRRVIVACLGKGSSMCALRDGHSVESTSEFSDTSEDIAELEAPRSRRTRQAVEHLACKAGLYAGQLASALEGLDAFVFTGPIGESSAKIRASVAEKLSSLGATLDTTANANHARLISRRDSRIPLYVIPSDDELTVARHTLTLLLNGPAPQ